MTNTISATPPGAEPKLWFGHPRLLALLFTTEMWERFGYYGMRAVLVVYLAKHFLFSDNVAYGLYGAFTSLVYLTPLIGGIIADQYIGSKRAVKTGAILMSIGYLMMAATGGDAAKPYAELNGQRYELQVKGKGDAETRYIVDGSHQYKITGNDDKSLTIEGATGAVPAKVEVGHYKFDGARNPLNVALLFVSLALVIIGNGYFKPNITTILGQLYDRTDSRRDVAYTIFYMGINVGSTLSQYLVPWVSALWGFQWGFALAGIGMILAWARFQFAGPQLEPYGNAPEGAKKIDVIFYVATLLAVPVVWFLLNNAMVTAQIAHKIASVGVIGFLASLSILGQVMFTVFFGALIGLPIWSFFTVKREERDRMIVACVLTFYAVVFWTLFEQAGSSMTLFADRNTNLHITSTFTMEAGQTQIFNPIFIVTFAPLFSIMWTFLAKRGIEPSAPLKFAIGLVLAGVGFLALVFGAKYHGPDFRVPLVWLALAYWFHSMGELCVSPVGLSAISKLSIPKLVAMMFGVWLMASAMAQYVGGIIAQLASTETVAGKVLNPQVALDTYLNVFQTIGIAGILAGGVAFLLWPLLKKMMHGIR